MGLGLGLGLSVVRAPDQPALTPIDPSGWETFDAFRFASGDASAMSNMGGAGRFTFGFGGGTGSATLAAGSMRLVTDASNFQAIVWRLVGNFTDTGRVVDFSAALPSQIAAAYQPDITQIRVTVKGTGSLALELKNAAGGTVYTPGYTVVNSGTYTTITWTPTPGINPVMEMLLIAGNSSDIYISKVEFYVAWASQIRKIDFALVTTLAQLLRCYDPSTGAVRDKADTTVGTYDSTTGGGLLCMACAAAVDAGIMAAADANTVINKVVTWLNSLTKHSTSKLLPHFVASGTIATGSEWSTIDSSISLLGAALACTARSRAADLATVEAMIDAMSFSGVVDGSSYLRHGFDDGGTLLASSWDYFGGEAIVAFLLPAYKAPNTYSSRFTMAVNTPPVWRNRGFIGELGALFCTQMSSGTDVASVDWGSMRRTLLAAQRAAVAVPLGGLSEGEYLSAAGALTFKALDCTPTDNAVGAESPFAVHDYSMMAGELSLARWALAFDFARAQGAWTTIGGLSQSALASGSNLVAGQINWRINSLRSGFACLGCYAARQAALAKPHALRAAAVSNSRMATALTKMF